jgi:peptidyl-prolyl cis-trans isomerase SurA
MIKPISHTLGALTLSSALLLPLAAQAQQPLDKVIAIVDEDVVLDSEFQERLAITKANIARSGQPGPSDKILHDQLLNQMIVESIQLQMARRAGIRIGDTELNNAINNIAQRNGMNLLQFKEELEKSGQSYLDFRAQIQRDMIFQTVQGSQVGRRVKVSDREIENFLKSEEGVAATAPEYLFHHTLVPVTSEEASADQAAKQFADKLYQQIQAGTAYDQVGQDKSHPSQSSSLGWRKLQDLPTLLKPHVPSFKKGQTLAPVRSPSGYHLVTLADKRGDSQLVKQTRVRHILLKESAIRDNRGTETQLREIRQRITGGEDFAELAREYSEDIGSAQEGGDLGWASPGQMVPAFETMMQKTEPGSVSPVFESRFGWHILEVLDRREQDMSELMRKNIARNILHERKFKDEKQLWLQKIRDEAFVSIK